MGLVGWVLWGNIAIPVSFILGALYQSGLNEERRKWQEQQDRDSRRSSTRPG
jgi:hypothetical protein